MATGIHFSGPARYRFLSFRDFSRAVVEASVRRILKGPLRPSWNWFVELATEVLKRRMIRVLKTADVGDARQYLDSVSIDLPEMASVNVTPIDEEQIRGSWFTCKDTDRDVTILYFHGGGYSFYPKTYASFIALITSAARSRTLALDYRLAPEHRFPTQLEDALVAYRWLLQNGTDPDKLIFAGDSAGANLALALLLAARDAKLPMPALAVTFSPPTDFQTDRVSANQDCDWIEKQMLERWADWFCDTKQRRNPLISIRRADLTGLPPIYIQAGRAEILYDSIRAFTDDAKSKGRDVVLESWEDMNHIFQIFGRHAPQSDEALQRLGGVIDELVRGRKKAAAVPV